MKTILIGSLLLVAVSGSILTKSSCDSSSAQQLTEGCKSDKDMSKLLLKKQIVIPGKLFSVRNHRLTFPAEGVGKHNISCILVKNLQGDKPGCVNLLEGGVGSKEFTLQFSSQRGGGLKFSVEVYTKKK